MKKRKSSGEVAVVLHKEHADPYHLAVGREWIRAIHALDGELFADVEFIDLFNVRVIEWCDTLEEAGQRVLELDQKLKEE